MGTSARDFSRGHPDSDAGYNTSLAQLEQLVARGQQAATVQREAVVDIRTASAQKRDLRRGMLIGPIAHMSEVGTLAAPEIPALGKSFQVKPGVGTYQAFRTAARAMQAAAEANKEVLAKHGQSESVVVQFGQMLDQFDAAVTLGDNGRTAHKGATREPQSLGAWLSARQVLGTPKGSGAAAPGDGGTPETPAAQAAPGGSGSGTPAGGEVRPAA